LATFAKAIWNGVWTAILGWIGLSLFSWPLSWIGIILFEKRESFLDPGKERWMATNTGLVVIIIWMVFAFVVSFVKTISNAKAEERQKLKESLTAEIIEELNRST